MEWEHAAHISALIEELLIMDSGWIGRTTQNMRHTTQDTTHATHNNKIQNMPTQHSHTNMTLALLASSWMGQRVQKHISPDTTNQPHNVT